MCWGIQDLPFVEEIFKEIIKSLVFRNDCIQRVDVHSEDETMFTPEAKGANMVLAVNFPRQSSSGRQDADW